MPPVEPARGLLDWTTANWLGLLAAVMLFTLLVTRLLRGPKETGDDRTVPSETGPSSSAG